MKAKYKLGTVVQLAGGTFTQIDGIIINQEGVSYQGSGGVDNFSEGDVTGAYRLVTTRAPRGSKKGLTTKKNGRKGLNGVSASGVSEATQNA